MSDAEYDSLSQDTVFDLLSNSRRRFILSYLKQHDEPVDIISLAEKIAAWENDTEVEDLSSQERKRVYVSIYQTHVPKLESVGLVDYDSDNGTVQLADRANQIAQFLPDEDEEPEWERYYLILAAASLVLYALVTANVSFFAGVSGVGLGVVVATAFTVLAVIHYISHRRRRRSFRFEEFESR